jgi:Flp pilus assembly protein TadG
LVDVAVCLPVLCLICMGVFEACSLIYLQQSLKVAAYEAARVALVPGSTNTNIEHQADLILNARNVSRWSIAVTPSDRSKLLSGDFVTVTAAAPCEENSLLCNWFYRGRELSSSVVLMLD